MTIISILEVAFLDTHFSCPLNSLIFFFQINFFHNTLKCYLCDVPTLNKHWSLNIMKSFKKYWWLLLTNIPVQSNKTMILILQFHVHFWKTFGYKSTDSGHFEWILTCSPNVFHFFTHIKRKLPRIWANSGKTCWNLLTKALPVCWFDENTPDWGV